MSVKTELLKEAFAKFGEVNTFKPGDLIAFKDGMANKTRPGKGEPVIVYQMIEPVKDPEASRSTAASAEVLDVQAGYVDDDGDFLVYHYDSRRFEHYKK